MTSFQPARCDPPRGRALQTSGSFYTKIHFSSPHTIRVDRSEWEASQRKRSLSLLALIPILALATARPSAACHVIGHKNGEALCETTSDGPGQGYIVSPTETKIGTNITTTTSSSVNRNSRVRVRSSVDTIRRTHDWH